MKVLFAQYKPELLQKSTITEAENQGSESILLSNNSDNKQDACTTENDPNFVGRENAIAHLNKLINKGAKLIQIIAPGGVGKSTLAKKYLEKRFKPPVLEFNIAEQTSVKTVETVKDAKTAFEAYYHYLTIKQFEEAGKIIITKKVNKFQEPEYLGNSLLRFELLSHLKNAMHTLIPKLESSFYLSKIYNLQGTLYRYLGANNFAIESYGKSSEIAHQCLINKMIDNDQDLFWLNRMIILSHFHKGMCYIGLFDIEKAFGHFNTLHKLIKDNVKSLNKIGIKENERYNKGGLAFCYSIKGNKDKARIFADETYNTLFSGLKDQIGEWGQIYELLLIGKTYKNISEIEKSLNIYEQVINYARTYNSNQVKALALTGLAELYRIQNDFKKALTHHQQSIEILDKIGAKCDLAEAYFQLALTYQAMGDQANSQEYFNKALYLWSPEQIDAPKQIERVRKAMNCED